MTFFKGLKQGFQDFGHTITSTINFTLLFFVYFIGIGFTSIVAKSVNRHFLNLKKKKFKKSYWQEYNLTKEPKENYYRQF